jgi:hypothetical protein
MPNRGRSTSNIIQSSLPSDAADGSVMRKDQSYGRIWQEDRIEENPKAPGYLIRGM